MQYRVHSNVEGIHWSRRQFVENWSRRQFIENFFLAGKLARNKIIRTPRGQQNFILKNVGTSESRDVVTFGFQNSRWSQGV